MHHVPLPRGHPNVLKYAGMHRNYLALPLSFDSSSRENPNLRRRAERAETQTDRERKARGLSKRCLTDGVGHASGWNRIVGCLATCIRTKAISLLVIGILMVANPTAR